MHSEALGVGGGPRDSGWLPRDLLYRSTRSLAHQSDYGGSRKASSDLGYSGSIMASYDSGLGDSRLASSESVCGGLSTAATFTHSTSPLVEHYQKMTVQPHEEGKL